ncbi:unnamed protein product [Mortierella alpina]
MGVENAFVYLDQNGITGEEVELEDITEKIQVDVLSLLRAYIAATRKSILLSVLLKNARDNDPDADVAHECAQQLSSCLTYKLKQLGFRPGKSKLHFDGSSTVQKTKARDKRAHDDDGEVESVRSLVDKATQTIRTLALSPTTVTRSSKDKVLRAAKAAMRSFKSARVMDKGFIQALVEAMSDEWQDPHDRTKFRRYKTAEILKKLKLTANMWTVAAVVSNNDYSEHVRGCGLSTNVKVIKSISGARSMNKKKLLGKYCAEVKRSRKVPGLTPERIFFLHQEDLVNETQSASGLDQEIADMINMVQIFKRDYNARRRALSQTPADDPQAIDIDDDQSEAGSSPSQQPQAIAHDPQAMDVAESQSEGGSTLGQQQRRPHLAFMSSNKFKITTSPAPRRKKKSQKRKAKTLYNPASRRARLHTSEDTSTETTGGRKRKLKPATLIDQVLTKEFSTVSLDCGTLATQVAAAIQQNEVGDDDDRVSLAKTVTLVIQEMVFIGNEAMRCAQQAIACYFAEVIAEHCTLSPADIEKRHAKFSQFSKFRNNTFFTNLLQDIFRWHDDEDQPTKGRPRIETEANACIKDILGVNSAYRRALTKANKTVPFLKRTLTGGLTHFFEQCGVRLADQFQCHFLRNTAELVKRLKTENPAWVEEGEGKAILASINIKQGTSSKHDQLSLFWILNSHLPSAKQMAFLPESGFTDQFMHITELHLVHALYAHANKDCKQSLGTTKQKAEDHAANHPGDLTYRLFFSNRLQYRKNTVLMAPDRDIVATADIPLFDLHGRDLSAWKKHWQFRELLQVQIEDAQTYKELLDDGSSTKKYVPTGTIVINGHELQVLAYGLTKPKPPSTAPPNTTRAKLDDARQVFAPDQPIDDMLPDEDYVIVGIDPGICSTATATVMDTRTPQQLKNVTVSQGAQVHCTKTYMKGLHKAKRKTTFNMLLSGEAQARHWSVEELEGTIESISCSIAIGQSLGPSWEQLGQSILDRVHSLLLVQEQLRSFYTARMFKIKGYHRKAAIKATRNKAVDRIIKSSGLSEKWDESKGPRPVFVVGDGQFGSSRGPVLHQQFVSHLKKRAQALNMIVVYVDEFRTSKICCRCENVCKAQGRSLKCTGCGYERDRDHNAATNMARAVLMLIREERWPDVLCRDFNLDTRMFISTQ